MRGQKVSTSPQGNEWLPNVVTNLTAAGTTQANATVIPPGQDSSIFSTVASGTGAVLPGSGVGVGEDYEVANHGANALLIYPALGGKIGTLGTNVGYSLAAGKLGWFRYVGVQQWTACP